ncbi:uncharacterized protein [Desmodus rotundus]|uniref:uncharacterized protein n=1 Tax=Desmodus rotundus TaxID=9430 RepID=UPI0023810A9C|nr:uncharacterized protein LOC123478618 [Desmodus rotundus]
MPSARNISPPRKLLVRPGSFPCPSSRPWAEFLLCRRVPLELHSRLYSIALGDRGLSSHPGHCRAPAGAVQGAGERARNKLEHLLEQRGGQVNKPTPTHTGSQSFSLSCLQCREETLVSLRRIPNNSCRHSILQEVGQNPAQVWPRTPPSSPWYRWRGSASERPRSAPHFPAPWFCFPPACSTLDTLVSQGVTGKAAGGVQCSTVAFLLLCLHKVTQYFGVLRAPSHPLLAQDTQQVKDEAFSRSGICGHSHGMAASSLNSPKVTGVLSPPPGHPLALTSHQPCHPDGNYQPPPTWLHLPH